MKIIIFNLAVFSFRAVSDHFIKKEHGKNSV